VVNPISGWEGTDNELATIFHERRTKCKADSYDSEYFHCFFLEEIVSSSKTKTEILEGFAFPFALLRVSRAIVRSSTVHLSYLTELSSYFYYALLQRRGVKYL